MFQNIKIPFFAVFVFVFAFLVDLNIFLWLLLTNFMHGILYLLTNYIPFQITDVRQSKFCVDQPQSAFPNCMLQIKKLKKEDVPISDAVPVVLTTCWAVSTFMVLSSNQQKKSSTEGQIHFQYWLNTPSLTVKRPSSQNQVPLETDVLG